MNILGPSSVTISKSFTPKAISPGGTSTLTFKITNPLPETVSGVNFTDSFPAGLAVHSAPNISYNGCGAGIFSPTLTGGETSISFVNGTITPNSVCTISLTVTAPEGTYPNATSTLKIYGSTDTGNVAADTLKASSAPPCVPGQSIAQWTFPPGFNVSSPAPTSGAGSATPGAGVNATSFPAGSNSWGSNGGIATGATLNTTNNDYFEFVIDTSGFSSVDLTFDARRGTSANSPTGVAVYYGSATGNPETGLELYNNANILTTTLTNIGGTLTFTPPASTTYVRIYFFNSGNTNPGSDAMMDNVTFTGCAIPTPAPTISKSFSPDTIVKGADSTLTFVVNNTQPGNKALTGISFTDVLPAGLSVPDSVSSACGGTNNLTTTASTRTISLTGGSLAAGASCLINIAVTGATEGQYENVSGFISSAQSGTSTNYATASLTVIAPPDLDKSFSPTSVLVGEPSTLTFTINNPNITTSLSNISFTDTLPAGLTLTSSGPTPVCGGFLTTTSPNLISFSSGSLPANSSCSFDVQLTGITAGPWDNTTSTVSSAEGGIGAPATATLNVSNPLPLLGLNKQISTDGTNWFKFVGVTLPGNVYYRFTISNDGETALSSINVDDTVVSPCVLPTSLAIGESASCVVGPLPVNSIPTPNPYMNMATADSAETGEMTSSAKYGTKSLSLDKSADKSSFTAIGDLLTYSYLVTNTGGYPLLAPITIDDDKADDETCPDVNTVGDFDNYLDPGESITCAATYTVSAADMLAGFVTNIASASSDGVTSNEDRVTVSSPGANLGITKTDGLASATPGQTITYIITVTNAGPSNATGATVTDTFPGILTGVTWTCVGTGGATCTASGSGDINDTVNIPVGGTATYTVNATVSASATGTLTNTATVTAPAGVTDPTPGNNSATDTTTVSSPSLFDPPSGFKTVNSAGYPELVWRMVWINNGNSNAISVVITDPIPSNTNYVNGSLTCSPQGSSSTSQCYFDSVNNRIVWQGTIAADPGASNETLAQNEVIITFRTTMNTSVSRVENQGCAQIPGGPSSCTDNPSTPASGDPTVWTKAPSPVAVPTMSEWGFIVLLILQGTVAVYYLRSRVRH